MIIRYLLFRLSRKRPLSDGYEKEPPLCTRKRLAGLQALQPRCETDGATEHAILKTSCTPDTCVKGETETGSFLELLSSWADTQYSVKKVLQHLRFRQANDNVPLNESVNKRFLEFHHDITEECGTEDKQHSWAVIEKREEIVMYGPYYPNYNNGEHSEDIIIKQTQELLECQSVSEDWKVYIFTTNSPCLARNTHACMLNLVQKAQEWWSMYGVKTCIGYLKCWGFKGAKETLFKDINYIQVDCVDQTEDHKRYAEAAEKTEINPLCDIVFAAVKPPLRFPRFSLINIVQGHSWKSWFKKINSVFESLPEEEKEICTQEANAVLEAAQVLLSEERSERVEECLERGCAFALDYTFSSKLSDTIRDQMRLTFQQCWKEMVRGKYAEFIREKLTEDFNQCTVQLFIKDIAKFTKEYLEIGRIHFLEDAPQVAQ
ncbi:uncharacterized protein LOC130202469 isoform X1 [Pseudoliparis swirei]|uniref:uncharacterized protein LOC130202469 isoform X1 n=1 Tax=Pseudoliparis swirei TaxID=2059687 RepID=UPI0024BE1F24|nr:uncharacterized protein LOC130202469 isoform X1 [Pseudoliparis swirei]